MDAAAGFPDIQDIPVLPVDRTLVRNHLRFYRVALLELDGLCYAIPLRSHILHPYCFAADTVDEQKTKKAVYWKNYEK
jgi:hypothetical protein